MADDLIIKFFREDLTEAEEQKLQETLSSSVEESWRFFQHAETAYQQYGLPEPHWPGDRPSSGMGLKHWFEPFLLVLALSSFGWALAHFGVKIRPVPTPSLSTAPPANASRPASRLPDPPEETDTSMDREKSTLDPGPRRGTSVPGSEVKVDAVVPVPAVAAPRSHQAHSNLEVVVRRSRPTALRVRVVGPDGAQVVLLYQGTLDPGTWVFDWDGQLADGGKPAPGDYRIQVESGAVTQVKKVVIH
jgi:hypothetical protein